MPNDVKDIGPDLVVDHGPKSIKERTRPGPSRDVLQKRLVPKRGNAPFGTRDLEFLAAFRSYGTHGRSLSGKNLTRLVEKFDGKGIGLGSRALVFDLSDQGRSLRGSGELGEGDLYRHLVGLA